MTLDSNNGEIKTFITLHEDLGQQFDGFYGAISYWSNRFFEEYVVASFTRQK